MTSALRAALYLRISDKKNSAQKIKAQESRCRAFAIEQGYEVDDSLIFIDEAISGMGHKVRERFDQLLDAVILNRVDVIVATEEERFARNIEDKAELSSACIDAGVTWHTIADGQVDPSSDVGEFFSILRAAMGRMESRRKATRQRASNTVKREAGLPTPGRRTYGYANDGMTPIEEEAETVRMIFRVFLAGGSIRSIVRVLHEAGIEPTTGRSWSTGRIRYILGNPRYGGALSHKGEIIPSEHVVPIVEPEDAESARALLADEKRRVTPGPGVKHLMSGIAVCGVCDSKMHFMRTYRCKGDPTHPSIQKKTLDPIVEKEVLAALLLGGAALTSLDEDAAAVAPLTASLARVEGEATQVLEERSDGLISNAVAHGVLVRLRQERESIEKKLDEARERSAIARLLLDLRLRMVPGERVSIEDAARTKGEIRARWEALDLDVKRTLVRALVDVTVSPGRKPERVVVTHRLVSDLNAGMS